MKIAAIHFCKGNNDNDSHVKEFLDSSLKSKGDALLYQVETATELLTLVKSFKDIRMIIFYAHGSLKCLARRGDVGTEDSDRKVNLMDLLEPLKSLPNLCCVVFMNCTVGRPSSVLKIISHQFKGVLFLGCGVPATAGELSCSILGKFIQEALNVQNLNLDEARAVLENLEKREAVPLDSKLYFYNKTDDQGSPENLLKMLKTDSSVDQQVRKDYLLIVHFHVYCCKPKEADTIESQLEKAGTIIGFVENNRQLYLDPIINRYSALDEAVSSGKSEEHTWSEKLNELSQNNDPISRENIEIIVAYLMRRAPEGTKDYAEIVTNLIHFRVRGRIEDENWNLAATAIVFGSDPPRSSKNGVQDYVIIPVRYSGHDDFPIIDMTMKANGGWYINCVPIVGKRLKLIFPDLKTIASNPVFTKDDVLSMREISFCEHFFRFKIDEKLTDLHALIIQPLFHHH